MNIEYEIQLSENGKFELKFINEPEYCQALIMSPAKREAKLNDGIWLVLLFAVWSVPDIDAIKMAVTLAKKFKGKVKVGVRPFDYHQENQLWCPEIKETFASPIWLVLKDGQLIMEQVGRRTEEELTQMLELHDGTTIVVKPKKIFLW